MSQLFYGHHLSITTRMLRIAIDQEGNGNSNFSTARSLCSLLMLTFRKEDTKYQVITCCMKVWLPCGYTHSCSAPLHALTLPLPHTFISPPLLPTQLFLPISGTHHLQPPL